jgi:hypothetical protein
MIIRYENTIEDMVAFIFHHYDHSPAQRRIRAKSIWGTAVFFLLLFSLPAWAAQDHGWLIVGAVIAALWVLIIPRVIRRSLAGNVRRVYEEGRNKSAIGPHELELAEDGLIERTPYGESIAWWHGIEKVVSEDDYTFIYLTAVSGHVVPRDAVSEGNYEAFVDAVEEQVALNRPS